MIARDTPCEGPMVTEMGLNVPSPLMPMVAPETPFEGPMVNYLDAYGSPWMPMHSPDEPFEGPMVNEIGASVPSPLMPMIAPDTPFEGPMVNEIGASVPSPLMPMIAPDTPFEGPMVNEIGAGLPPQLMPMVAPDTPFEGPMVNEIGASTLYGGEMIPLLPPGAVYTSRDGSTWSMGTDGHVCHCVSVTLTVRPAAYVLGDGQHTRAYFGAWDGGDSQREFLAVADGFGRGLVTGGKAVVNSFVAVATLGYVPEAIAVTSEDRGNGYDTAALFGASAGRRFSPPPAWGWPTRTSASATPASRRARRF